MHNDGDGKRTRIPPSAALVEMLQWDGELDRILDGRGLTFYTPLAIRSVRGPKLEISLPLLRRCLTT